MFLYLLVFLVFDQRLYSSIKTQKNTDEEFNWKTRVGLIKTQYQTFKTLKNLTQNRARKLFLEDSWKIMQTSRKCAEKLA